MKIKTIEGLKQYLEDRNDIAFRLKEDPRQNGLLKMDTKSQYNEMSYELKLDEAPKQKGDCPTWMLCAYEQNDIVASVYGLTPERVEELLRHYGVRQKIVQERLL